MNEGGIEDHEALPKAAGSNRLLEVEQAKDWRK